VKVHFLRDSTVQPREAKPPVACRDLSEFAGLALVLCGPDALLPQGPDELLVSVKQTRARLAEAELRLQAAREREVTSARTQRALAERARHELASCPRCRQPVRGSDLLVSGHCPNCSKAITTLLSPRPQLGAPDRDEYLALLGALGGLVGLALASTNENTN
jgi:hypothetical protein